MTTINKAFRVKTGLAVEGGAILAPAGTTSYPPILLTSGTNLTSATAGAFEFDGTNFYLTPSTTRKTISFTDHVHGNLTSAGAIGSTSGLVVLTGASGVLTTLSAGTTSQYLRGDGTWQTVVNTDTNYYPSTIVFNAGTTAGPTLDLTMAGDGAPDLTAVAIPSASGTASGVVTTADQTFAGVKTFSSSPIVPTPTNATDAANKSYVDNAIVGIDWKPSVNVATTGALGTAGNLVGGTITTTYSNGSSGVGATLTIASSSNWTSTTIDGYGTPIGTRVLIKNQANSAHNGIYTVTQLGTTSSNASFIFTRATDSDTTGELTSGHAVFVEYGTSNADSGWTCISDGTNIVGTAGLAYTQFTGLGQVTAGLGILKSGNTISIDHGSVPLLYGGWSTTFTTSANTELTLPESGTLIANPVSTSGVPSVLNITGQTTSSSAETGGDVTIKAGNSTSSNGNGGYVRIYGGTGGSSNTAAAAVLIEGSDTTSEGIQGSVQVGTNAALTGYVSVGTYNQIVKIAGNEYRTEYASDRTSASEFVAGVWDSSSTDVASAKVTVTARTSTDVHVVEALVAMNAAGNLYVTTYGEVTSNAALFTLTFQASGSICQAVVTPVGGTSTDIRVASVAYETF